ncbi:MAG: hypothetical protein MK207_00915 [Saprospiraceae bacterium]|nr:hypothetical protein [Saprospiraceae bacterium]
MKQTITCITLLLLSLNVSSQQLQGFFQIATEQPSVVVAATDKLMATEFGQNFRATVVLYSELFNGKDKTTHTLGFFFEDAKTMEKSYDQWMNSEDVAKWAQIVNDADEDTGNFLARTIYQGGENPSEDRVFMRFTLSIKDEDFYAKAYAKFAQDAEKRDLLNKGSHGLSAIIGGANPKMTHFAYVGARNIPELLKKMEMIQKDERYLLFSKQVSQIRTIEKQDMVIKYKSWNERK